MVRTVPCQYCISIEWSPVKVSLSELVQDATIDRDKKRKNFAFFSFIQREGQKLGGICTNSILFQTNWLTDQPTKLHYQFLACDAKKTEAKNQRFANIMIEIFVIFYKE